jgi:probable phosphoglycerate mutase
MKTRVRILTDLQEAPFKVASYLPQAEHPLYKPAFPELSHEYTLFKAQVRRAFTQLVHVSEEHRRVIAMTHGGVIKTILRLILGNDSICFEINNASLTLLEWRDGIWRLLLLNCQEHLPEDLRCSSVHKKILGFHNG